MSRVGHRRKSETSANAYDAASVAQRLIGLMPLAQSSRSAPDAASSSAPRALCLFTCCKAGGALMPTGTAPADVVPFDDALSDMERITAHRTQSVYGGKTRILRRYRLLR